MKDRITKAIWAGALLGGCISGPEPKPPVESTNSKTTPVKKVQEKKQKVSPTWVPACENSEQIVTLSRLKWKEQVKKEKHDGVYTVCADTNDFECPSSEDMDAPTQDRLLNLGLKDRYRYCNWNVISLKKPPVCGPVKDPTGNQCCYTLHVRIEHAECEMEGRPFIVDGVLRKASLVSCPGWSRPVHLAHDEPLADALRERIAASWAEAGIHEHASVASFAKFVMELMWLGAPRELVQAATQAMDDEIRHAHDCFSIASAYAGFELGPDSLEIEGSLAHSQDTEEILKAAIIEGCIGETLAAAEAAFKLEHAIEPEAKRALEAICEEETQHAELAWSFVSWLLAKHPELAHVARQAFEEHGMWGDSPWLVGVESVDSLLLAHGALSESLQDAVRRDAFHTQVAPVIDLLLTPVRMSA